MAQMTPAESERSQRVCEALGTLACSFLLWTIFYKRAQTVAACSDYLAKWYDGQLPKIDPKLIGLIVLLSYGGVFAILDRWRSRRLSPAATPPSELPNWCFISLIGTFIACLNASAIYPQLFDDCTPHSLPWLLAAIVGGIGYGFLAFCVMFCFWVLGYVVRYTRGQF